MQIAESLVLAYEPEAVVAVVVEHYTLVEEHLLGQYKQEVLVSVLMIALAQIEMVAVVEVLVL